MNIGHPANPNQFSIISPTVIFYIRRILYEIDH